MKKLDFSTVRVQGRSKELAILRDAHQRVKIGSCAEIVLVSGYSGTGKSSLIRRLKSWIEETTNSKENRNNYFCCGKFSQFRAMEPYSALAFALNDLCNQIMESNDTDATITSFKEVVGSKGKVLLNVVPNLSKMMGPELVQQATRGDTNPSADSTATRGTTATALNQLKFVFQAFIRSVCAVTKQPVVLFLDDCQWSDVASLELLKSMVADSKLQNLLFVGAFRENEIHEEHPLAVCIREIGKGRMPITRIQLGNLDKETVNDLISNMTELKPTETQPLTDIVYRKTIGNVFFVLQFLRMLQDEELLCFSLTTFKFTWDIDKIRSETTLADNVVDLVVAKIKKLPFKTQIALELASCVWSTFEADLLQEIMTYCLEKYKTLGRHCETMLSKEDDLVELLDIATQEGLLDKIVGTRYKFSHDRIQQAAYSLIPEGRERDLVHVWIGELLVQMTESPHRQEWMYFAAADQVNRGSSLITDDEKRLEAATLNLRAGEHAVSLSAFVPAATYLKCGIDHVPEAERWGEHYSLSLRLHNVLADMEFCNGNSENVERVVEEVVSNARSFRDTIDVCFTRCVTLLSTGRVAKGLRVCYHVLHNLGEPLPTRGGRTRFSLECMKLRRMLRGRSDSDLLSLPPMQDDRKITAMKFCHLTHVGALRQVSPASVKMMEMTLKFGVSPASPHAFVSWGELMVNAGDVQEGYRFGKLALKLAENLGIDTIKAAVTGRVYVYLNHWMVSLQNGLDPFLNAHRLAMVNGRITEAFQCILAYQQCYWYSGLPLHAAVEDLISYSKQMKEYKQNFICTMMAPSLQLMLNLMNRHSGDILRLTGEIMDQADFEDPKKNPDRSGLQAIASCRMQLAYYFGHLELAAKLSKELQKVSKADVYSASYLVCLRTMFFGLIAIAVARKTKKRKHAVKARKLIDMMENTWVKRGAVNCLHKLLLLKAEYASLGHSSETDKVKDAYDKAISCARRTGFIQDEALANERAGLFFLERSDEFWASSYLSRSRVLFREWGAEAKGIYLEEKHGDLLVQHEEHHASHLRGRSRFSESPAKNHKSLPANRLVG